MQNATHAAEAALLGSLLLDLRRPSTIRAVLRPDDFATGWNQVVFTVLAEGQVRDIFGVAEVLAERLGPSRANIIGLHDLIRDVPVKPDLTGYATMVVEASLRRQVACLAVLAQACGSTDPHTNNQISAITAMVRDQVHGLNRRWQRTQSALRTDRPRGLGAIALGPPEHGTPQGLSMGRFPTVQQWCLAADRIVAATPPRDEEAQRAVQIRFVAAQIDRPSAAAAWVNRVRPQALTATEWRPVLAAIQRRVELSESTDVVSIAWEVQRAAHRHGPGPSFSTLKAAAEASCHEDVNHLGRLVAHDVLARTADGAAASIRRAAAHPGLPLCDVLDSVVLMLNAIDRAAAPLADTAAASPPPPLTVRQLQSPAAPSTTAIGW